MSNDIINNPIKNSIVGMLPRAASGLSFVLRSRFSYLFVDTKLSSSDSIEL